MRRSVLRCAGAVVALFVAVPAAIPAAPAALRIIEVGDLRLAAPPTEERALAALAAHARIVLPQIESHLGVRAAGSWRMILIPPGGLRDSALASLDRAAPPWASGYMIPGERLGAIRMSQAAQYPYGSLESVLAHEATHLMVHDAVPGGLPRWFDEGVATWEGRRWSLEDVMIYSAALLRGDLPPLADLDPAFRGSAAEAREAYAAAFAFVAWGYRNYGDDVVRDVLRDARHRPFPIAWRLATGVTLAASEAAWRRESLSRFRWIALLIVSNGLWIGLALITLIGGIVRRARARAARARWVDEEESGSESDLRFEESVTPTESDEEAEPR